MSNAAPDLIAPGLVAPERRWTGAVAMGVTILVLLAIFHAEAAAAVIVWRESTAFGHCVLVAPIAVWLAWERRDRLQALGPEPRPAAALIMLPLGLAWFAAERLGIMEGRQLAALAMFWVLVPAVLGWRLAWAMAVPLGYLVFLVPFGAFLVPALQVFVAGFIDAGLGLLGIPHVVTATLIEIPEGVFRVAEACAGLRFMIAAIAFGVLYACVIYRSAWRRLGFIAVCVGVPVLANGVRALGIVLLGHVTGSAAAGAVDHVLYGWIFFSLVLVLMLLLGLPFRQDSGPFAPPASRPRQGPPAPARLVLAGLTAVLLAAVGPAGAAWLQTRAATGNAAASQAGTAAALDRLRPAAGCAAAAAPDTRRFTCGPVMLEARVQVFGATAGPDILAAQRAALVVADAGEEAEDARRFALRLGETRWQVVTTRDPNRATAAALWLDDRPAPAGLALRLAAARHGLATPGEAAPATMLMIVTATGAPSSPVTDILSGFLRAQGELGREK